MGTNHRKRDFASNLLTSILRPTALLSSSNKPTSISNSHNRSTSSSDTNSTLSNTLVDVPERTSLHQKASLSESFSSLFYGSTKPLAEPDHSCVLFPSYAYRRSEDPNSDWVIKIKGRAFLKPKQSRGNKFALALARRMAGVSKDGLEYKKLEERFAMFLDTNALDLSMMVEIVGLTSPGPMKLVGSKSLTEEPEEMEYPTDTPPDFGISLPYTESPPSSKSTSQSTSYHIPIDIDPCDKSSTSARVQVQNGHFNSTIKLSNSAVSKWKHDAVSHHPQSTLVLQAYHSPASPPAFGQIQLVERHGVSIISDIDDTIKDSGVYRGKKAVLMATFLHECREVEGMSDVYKYWWLQGGSFHYVSNSPWQLFPMLEQFFKTFSFPIGSAHLKLWDMGRKALFYDPQIAKKESILNLLMDFPNRHFVLVGDSGEMDLEMYTAIARDYPKQIIKIFIRDVTTTFLKPSSSKPSLSPKFSSISLSRLMSGSNSSSHSVSSVNTSQTPTLTEFRSEDPCPTDLTDDDKYILSLIDEMGSPASQSSPDLNQSFALPAIPSRINSFSSTISAPQPDLGHQSIRAKFQQRVSLNTQGLPPNLVTIFQHPDELLECKVVKRYLDRYPDNFKY